MFFHVSGCLMALFQWPGQGPDIHNEKQLLHAGAGPIALFSAQEMHHTDNGWLGRRSAFHWHGSPLALL